MHTTEQNWRPERRRLIIPNGPLQYAQRLRRAGVWRESAKASAPGTGRTSVGSIMERPSRVQACAGVV
jgi:hypothetical protein